jgi:hypothetical protein
MFDVLLVVGGILATFGLELFVTERRKVLGGGFVVCGLVSLTIALALRDAPEQTNQATAKAEVQDSDAAAVAQNSPGAVQHSPGARVKNVYYQTVVDKLEKRESLDRVRLRQEYPGGYMLLYASDKWKEMVSPSDAVGFVPEGTTIDWGTVKLVEITPRKIIVVAPDITGDVNAGGAIYDNLRVSVAREAGYRMFIYGITEGERSFGVEAQVLQDEASEGVILAIGLKPIPKDA